MDMLSIPHQRIVSAFEDDQKFNFLDFMKQIKGGFLPKKSSIVKQLNGLAQSMTAAAYMSRLTIIIRSHL